MPWTLCLEPCQIQSGERCSHAWPAANARLRPSGNHSMFLRRQSPSTCVFWRLRASSRAAKPAACITAACAWMLCIARATGFRNRASSGSSNSTRSPNIWIGSNRDPGTTDTAHRHSLPAPAAICRSSGKCLPRMDRSGSIKSMVVPPRMVARGDRSRSAGRRSLPDRNAQG